MKILWLIVNTIVSSWCSYAVLFNPIIQAVMGKWGSSAGETIWFLLLSTLAALHIILVVGLCVFISIDIAVVVISIVTFGWALMCYFLLQRFASVFDRPLIVQNHPMLYILLALGGFISSNLAIIFFLGWLWVFIPISLWLLLGLLCAEISIQGLIKRGYDRKTAIFSINETQGRINVSSLFQNKLNRYPFP